MVNSTVLSKAAVPVLVLLLCGLFYGRFVLSLALCYFILLFFSPFTSHGEERANLSAFRTFVRFAFVWFCLFPFPLGIREGLRLVIVAFPGIFFYLFFKLGRKHRGDL